MSMKLKPEQQQMVLNNQRLVHYLVRKLGVTPNSADYEDLVSIGTIGLIKAASTFDESKKNTFSTYATVCIKNELTMNYRKAKKYANDISLECSIEYVGDDGKEIALIDMIVDPESNFIEKNVIKEDFIQLVSIILNYLESKERLVMLLKFGNIGQIEMAEKLNISQPHVSRLIKKAIFKIREAINYQLRYKEMFSMNISGNFYEITFASKEIKNFNKIFAGLLKNIKSVTDLPDFKVICNKERIIVKIPAYPEAFVFIAQIIQKIDDFSMTYVSNKNILPVDKTISQKVESDIADESNNIAQKTKTNVIEQNDLSISTKVDTVLPTDTDLQVRSGNKIKDVIEYMLSKDSFTVNELKQNFPNINSGNINNALMEAKRKELIEATARGKYVIKKS